MRHLRHLVAASIIFAMAASPAYSQSITTLLTPEECAAAGLSKLTPSEVAALDAALLRVLGELVTALMPDAASGRAGALAMAFYDRRTGAPRIDPV